MRERLSCAPPSRLLERSALSPVVVQPSRNTVWLWASATSAPDGAALTATKATLGKKGQRLAAGAVRFGLAGLRQSHRDARFADRPSPSGDDRAPVVLYQDVGPRWVSRRRSGTGAAVRTGPPRGAERANPAKPSSATSVPT
ncbi:hypothetical protein [Prauserella aidingensis]|uniref:hypothetical protein n=1 Tax=Prauserella aidingensis TaxID=387890 RepID=UPI003557DC10